MADTLVIWDFDWTLINENSDTYVIDRCGGPEATQMMKAFDESTFWTERMSRMCEHLTGQLGVTERDISACMRGIPVFAENLELVRALGAKENVAQVIVSDANTLFIESYLAEMGLQDCFDAVYTNPVIWCSNSRGVKVLSVQPFVDKHQPHGCSTCARTPNMCKGAIVDTVRAKFLGVGDPAREKTVYLGDGRGDFCGACRLTETDMILCRQGFALSDLLSETPPAAEVARWSDGRGIRLAFEEVGLL